MRDDERARRELMIRLEEVLGPDQAATMMENLPPRPWSELVTKDDLDPLKADVETLKSDVGVLKSDVETLKSDVETLKSDVGVLKSDVGILRKDVDLLRTDVDVLKRDVGVLKEDVGVLKEDVGALRHDVAGLRTEMQAGFAHLGEVLDLRFAAQDARFEAFVRERMDSQTKLLVFAFVGALLTTAGIALGSVAL